MIVVVGGGVMGCTLSYVLAAQGRSVTLLERAHLGDGASGVPVALLNPYRGRSARASPYDLEALTVMWRLVDELETQGFETGVHQSGVLRVASNGRQARTWRTREGVRWLEPGTVPEGYHAPFGGFLVPTGGWLEPSLWLRALTDAAVRRGATVRQTCDVQRIMKGPEGGFELQTTKGEVRADSVILTSGGDTALGQGELGLERVAGEVLGLHHERRLPHPLAGAVYGAQRGDTFFLGGNHRPDTEDDPRAPAALQQAGSWFIPSLRDAPLTTVWHGVRVRTEGNLPVVRALHPGLVFVGALAGRGFLCAAQVAETVAKAL